MIIPAYNEERSIANVIGDIPKDLVTEIIVVNNHSSDRTEENARAAGATVLTETEKGYGAACLNGIRYAQERDPKPDIIVFLDGDYSDYPDQMPAIIKPILEEGFDLVIGSRTLGKRAWGSMTIPQLFGNWLACSLMKGLYHTRYSDLGPFRSIRYESLMRLNMQDRNFGWTVEMQLKAAKQKLKVCEVPVDYRKRIGVSKVSGTVKGTILAGYKILTTIFKYR